MSDLKLLSSHQPSPLERLLMDSASKEAPSPEQRMRVRAALGLPALGLAPPGTRFSRTGVLVKGAIAGAIVVSALVLQFRSNHGTPTAQSQPQSVAQVSAAVVLPAQTTELSPEPVAEPLPEVEVAPAVAPSARRSLRSAARAASAPTAAASGTDLSEQLRLIEAARAAVSARNPAAASRALTSYRTQFPRGAFSQEASVLRIETMDLQGNHAQAATLAKSFLARHPNSPHVGLVQRIAGSAH